MTRVLLMAGLALMLCACGEKPQALSSPKQDAPAYSGTGTGFASKNWQQGDKTSWEQQLRVRGQNGQNEYNKTE